MDGTETQAGFNYWYQFPPGGNRPRASIKKGYGYKWVLLLDTYQKPYICEALEVM